VHVEHLVIRNGRDEPVPMFLEGGGLTVFSPIGGSVSIVDVEFLENIAYTEGAALDVYVGSVGPHNILVRDCRFDGNQGSDGGGAVSLNMPGGGLIGVPRIVQVVNNSFTNNHATVQLGGGLYVSAWASHPETEIHIERNLFAGNTATGSYGALGIYSQDAGVFLVNNLFLNNDSIAGSEDAVGINIADSEPVGNTVSLVFTNNTFYTDITDAFTRSLSVFYSTLNLDATMYNNVFWSEPRANFDFAFLASGSLPSEPDANNVLTLVSNNYSDGLFLPPEYLDVYETGYWSLDPLFADPPSDLRLSELSPLIDVGDNDAPALPEFDLAGNPRIANGIVDLGAYESAAAGPLTDIDIARFRTTKRIRLARVRPISINLTLRNEGVDEGEALATVVGKQNGLEIYRESVAVTVAAGAAPATIVFPPYVPVGTGDIAWQARLVDEDPDLDEESATTIVW
jgi:hypothetical protein